MDDIIFFFACSKMDIHFIFKLPMNSFEYAQFWPKNVFVTFIKKKKKTRIFYKSKLSGKKIEQIKPKFGKHLEGSYLRKTNSNKIYGKKKKLNLSKNWKTKKIKSMKQKYFFFYRSKICQVLLSSFDKKKTQIIKCQNQTGS